MMPCKSMPDPPDLVITQRPYKQMLICTHPMTSCAATALKVAADMAEKETIRKRKARQRKRREVRIVMSIVYMLTSILINVRKLYKTAIKLVSNCTYALWEYQLSTLHNALKNWVRYLLYKNM